MLRADACAPFGFGFGEVPSERRSPFCGASPHSQSSYRHVVFFAVQIPFILLVLPSFAWRTMFHNPSERIPMGKTVCAHNAICSRDGELSTSDGELSTPLGVPSAWVGTLLTVSGELSLVVVPSSASTAYLVNPTETRKDPICAVSKNGLPFPLSISLLLLRGARLKGYDVLP